MAVKKSKRIPPPAVVDGCRVLFYCHIRRPVVYSGHSYLFRGAREVGPVPRLIIGEPLRDNGIALLHCDKNWDVLGYGGGHKLVSEAKRRAESTYPGVTRSWVKLSVSKRKARQIEREMWRGHECSFCNRIPPDFDLCLHGKRARICNICAAKIFWDLTESQQLSVEPPQGDYFPENGSDHVESYIVRLIAGVHAFRYISFSPPDLKRGFALCANNTMFEAFFVVQALEENQRETRIRSYFVSRGTQPSKDYLANAGSTRLLNYPVHGSVEQLTTITKTILENVCGISPHEPLFIHYVEK